MLQSFDMIATETGFRDRVTKEVEPFLASVTEKGSFESYDGTKIAYRIFRNENARANLMLVHGFSEFMEKYNELIYMLLKNGFEVYSIDLRGHGHSDRTVKDPSMVDVHSFEEYVRDIDVFFNMKLKGASRKNFILGHSMGGAVAVRYCEEHPDNFEKAVFSSPMIRMRTGKFPLFFVRFVSALLCHTGKATAYAFGQTSFNPKSRLSESSCRSPERYEYIMDMRRNDPVNQTWGGSYNWVLAACRNTAFVLKSKNAAKITVPALVLAAGHDHLIDVSYTEKFAGKLPEGRYVFFPEARHEIYHSLVEDRTRFYEETISFLSE